MGLEADPATHRRVVAVLAYLQATAPDADQPLLDLRGNATSPTGDTNKSLRSFATSSPRRRSPSRIGP